MERKSPLKWLSFVPIALIVAVVIYALIMGPPRPRPQTPKDAFTLLYTGNLQGKLLRSTSLEAVDGATPADFARLYSSLSRLKAEAEGRGEPVIIVDLGNSLCGDEDIARRMKGIPMKRLMAEMPYAGMLLRQDDFALGIDSLLQMPEKIACLGLKMPEKDEPGKSPEFLKPVIHRQCPGYDVAIIGMFQPPGPDHRDDEALLKSTLANTKADCRIVLADVPNPTLLARRLEGADLIVNARFCPDIPQSRIGPRIRGDLHPAIAPAVDGRFFIGVARFVRFKGWNGWRVEGAPVQIADTGDVPPGGILNITIDACQNMDLAYKGRYQAIYENFAFWAPKKVDAGKLAFLMSQAYTEYTGSDGTIIDRSKLKLPADSCWGSRQILDMPGKTMHIRIRNLDSSQVDAALKLHKNVTFEGFRPDGGKMQVAVDDDWPGESVPVTVPGNFILLDYVRRHRGAIYIQLGGDAALAQACGLMDDRKYDEAAALFEGALKKGKTTEPRDCRMLLGMCRFKNGEFDKALAVWNEAASADPGVKRVLSAAPGQKPSAKPAAAAASHPWPKFRGDAANTGRTAIAGPQNALLRWRFTAPGKIISSPAVAKDDTVYTGCEDGHLYAIGPGGKLKWKFKTGMPIRSTPAIAPDGTIYVGSDDNHLYALDPAGNLKWKFKGGFFFSSSCAIGKDGTIYAGNEDFTFYAISPNGKEKWRYKAEKLIHSSPAIARDGTIYVGSEDHHLHAFSPDGKLKWKFKTDHQVNSSPAVGDNGAVYVGCEDNYLYAVSPGGTLLWKAATGNYITSSPALGKDGTIYVGSEDNHLHAFSPDGKLKWKFAAKGEVISAPLVDGSGNIYFGSDDGNLYCVDPSGKQKFVFAARDPIMCSPAIGTDGTLYVGSEDKNVYAIGQ